MKMGVTRIHAISQKKLKGRPKIMGCMRSQRETEKHMAAKGTSAKRSAPSDGRLTRTSFETVAGFYQTGGGIPSKVAKRQ